MKVFKRNAVIITVLIFVCVAVYLNWSYAQNELAAEAGKTSAQEETTENTNENSTENTTENSGEDTNGAEESGLFYVEDESGVETVESTQVSEYFDQVRLTREQARDSAEATLLTVTETEGAAQTTVDEAMQTMVNIAKWTEAEAQLESLVVAKGFQDCVAYMTEDGITVTVACDAEALSDSAVAQIKDIVLSETEYTADQLKIIEIK
ncbi:MAG: SpoIIIAH-like family protein [Ruminococcaceae bacterium]|nr:SpoIIIAH-like family protein [Oscillospiraceae bacterium]